VRRHPVSFVTKGIAGLWRYTFSDSLCFAIVYRVWKPSNTECSILLLEHYAIDTYINIDMNSCVYVLLCNTQIVRKDLKKLHLKRCLTLTVDFIEQYYKKRKFKHVLQFGVHTCV